MATTTVSLSILAGITFGFLYLIISGIKWASEKLENGAGLVGKDRCPRCGVLFRDVDEGTCSVCGLAVCTRCAIRYQHSWLCSSCIVKTDENLYANEWVLSHFKKRFESTVAIMKQFGKRESDVRDFVEKLTEHLVGGRLDNVRIDKVCSHPNYMKFMAKYERVLSMTLSRLTASIQMLVDGVHNQNVEQPKFIHQQLKSLINEIIDEANNLNLRDDEEQKMKELRSKTYEEILAIAVLNKATEKALTPISNGRYENLEMINNNNHSLISEFESEFEELVRETGYHDWNDNWVLEKKHDSCSSSVTMLIPSPIEEAKPRIGDIEVDQLSDLSDVETDPDPVHDIEEIYHSSLVRDNLRMSPNEGRNERLFNGLADVDDIDDIEYNHYKEPAIPSIVEARNNVFRSLDKHSSGSETEFEMKEQLRRISRNRSKVKIIEQAYSDRYKYDWELDDTKVSVRNLAKQFSTDGSPLVKYSGNSITCRNTVRDHISY